MYRVVPVDDEAVKISFEPKDAPAIVEHATNLHLIWTQCSSPDDKGNRPTLEASYENFRAELAKRWKQEVSAATAYVMVEALANAVSELKKTHIALVNSLSSESTPAAPTK